MKKKIYSVLVLGIMCAFCFLMLPITSTRAGGSAEFKYAVEVEENYSLGSSFDIPVCNVKINDATYKASHKLIFPDGRVSEYQTVVLDSVGEYQLDYFYNDGQSTYSETKYFNVMVENYGSLFTVINGAEVVSNSKINEWATNDLGELGGVNVFFNGAGGAIRYNGVIDLRNASKFDYFIEYIANVAKDQTQEIENIDFKLTDIRDENNYIEINTASSVSVGESGSRQLIRSSTNGREAKTGWSKDFNSVHSTGTEICSSFLGNRPAKFGPETFWSINTSRLSYVPADKQLYAWAYPNYLPQFSMDYDDPDYTDERYIWNGFSADLVYLTITVTNARYSNGSNLLITSINGNELSGGERVMPTDIFFDIDTLGYNIENLPNAIVNKKYPVFSAVAYDNYGIRVNDLRVSVFDGDGKSCTMVNGCFTPTNTGKYYVRYEANNPYVKKVYDVEINVVDTSVEIERSSISINSTVPCGGIIKLPDVEVSGGVGSLSVEKRVYLGESNVEIITDGIEDYFVANKPGVYSVKYFVKDWTGIIETPIFTQEVVSGGDLPYMVEPVVSPVNILGREVRLPRADAIIGHEGKSVYVPVKVYFDDKDITETLTCTPEIEGAHVVKYIAVNPFDSNKKTEYVFDVNVNDLISDEDNSASDYIDSFLQLDGFVSNFYTNENDASQNAYYLIADGSQSVAKMRFGRKITDEFLSVEFGAKPGFANFNEIAITFTDSENSLEKIEIVLKNVMLNGSYVTGLYLNDTYKTSLAQTLDGKAGLFQLFYNKSTRSIVDALGEKITDIPYTVDGYKFNGFSSGYAYLDFTCSGIANETIINLAKISSHGLNGIKYDIVSPNVVFSEDYVQTDTAFVGETFVIKGVKSYDVLSDTEISVKVQAPDGSVVYNGEYVKNKEIEFSKAGIYKVIYTFVDEDGNDTKKTVNVYVSAFEPPTISLDGELSSASANKETVLPKAIIAEDSNLYIYVVHPDGNKTTVAMKEDGTFAYVFVESGLYRVRYVVSDSNGNRIIYEIEVEV